MTSIQYFYTLKIIKFYTQLIKSNHISKTFKCVFISNTYIILLNQSLIESKYKSKTKDIEQIFPLLHKTQEKFYTNTVCIYFRYSRTCI